MSNLLNFTISKNAYILGEIAGYIFIFYIIIIFIKEIIKGLKKEGK